MKKYYIYFLKCIAILLVILMHTLSKTWNIIDCHTNLFKILTFIDLFCLVCVPLFFMCSGNIFLNRNDSLKKILLKYTLKIFLIYFIFNSIYWIFNYIFYLNTPLSIAVIKKSIINSLQFKSIFQFWYLKCVIITYLSIPILKSIINKGNKYIEYALLLFFITLFQIIPNFYDNVVYSSFVYLFGYIEYFYLGYFVEKHYNKNVLPILGILSIISCIYIYISTIKISILNNQQSTYYMQYLNLCVVVISVFVYLIAYKFNVILSKNKIKNITTFISKYILSIYLLHGLIIGFLNKINIIDIYNINNVLELFLYSIIISITSLICAIIFKESLSFIKRRIKKLNHQT